MEKRHRLRLLSVRTAPQDRTSRILLVSGKHPASRDRKVPNPNDRYCLTQCDAHRDKLSAILSPSQWAANIIQSCSHPTIRRGALREGLCDCPNVLGPAKRKSTYALRVSLPDDGSWPSNR